MDINFKIIPLKIANIINKIFNTNVSADIITFIVIVFFMCLSMTAVLFIYGKIYEWFDPFVRKPKKRKRK